MKVKRTLSVIGIIVLSLIIIIILGLKVNGSFFKGLSASVASVNENGDSLWIECEKETIDIDEEINCTIKGSSSKNVITFQGNISYDNSKIEISNITKSENFNVMGDNNDEDMAYVGDGATGSFDIGTFSVRGLESGQIQIKLTDIDEEHKLYMGIEENEGDLTYSYFDEVVQNITIGSAESTLSSDATLKYLKVNNVDVLNNLNFTLPSDTVSVVISAESNDPNATVTGDLGEKTLNTGSNTFTVTVKAEDQNTINTYTITITKEAAQTQSGINTLNTLSVYNGDTRIPFTTDFNAEVTDYVINVANAVDKVTINAEKTHSNATISGDIGEKNLSVGNNIFNIKVTAANGDEKIYNITIIREAKTNEGKSSDNMLKSLNITNVVLSPTFSSDVTNYTSTVDSSVSRIRIEAIANDSNSTLTGDLGERVLVNGINTFSITVKAENNTTKIYTINITKTKPSSNSTCSLRITSNIYNINEDNSTISIPIDHKDGTIISNINSSATVTVNGDKVNVKCDNQTKEYKINRYWVAATGQNAVKYVVIITGLVVIIGVLFVLKNKKNK